MCKGSLLLDTHALPPTAAYVRSGSTALPLVVYLRRNVAPTQGRALIYLTKWVYYDGISIKLQLPTELIKTPINIIRVLPCYFNCLRAFCNNLKNSVPYPWVLINRLRVRQQWKDIFILCHTMTTDTSRRSFDSTVF